MTDREKLVGLVKEICNTVVKACGCSDMLPTYSFCKNAVYESIADYLITNGVTVQEWISVKDRLPEKQEDVLMLFEHNMTVGFLYDGDEDDTFWCAYTDDGYYTDCDGEPTHWKSLPEPQKEE